MQASARNGTAAFWGERRETGMTGFEKRGQGCGQAPDRANGNGALVYVWQGDSNIAQSQLSSGCSLVIWEPEP